MFSLYFKSPWFVVRSEEASSPFISLMEAKYQKKKNENKEEGEISVQSADGR